MIVLLTQTLCIVSSFAGTIRITKFTKSPGTPNTTQTILFRARTEGEVEKVYMSIDGEKDIYFERKSNNVWELERKLTIVGTRYLKVTAVGKNNEKHYVRDTIEVVEKPEREEKTTSETTTERVFTGNIEKTTEEASSETTTVIIGGDDFDGGTYDEDSNVDDSYFDFAFSENMSALDEIAGSSVFMFVGDNTFIRKWEIKPIDETNDNVRSYIKNGYTLIPLRAVSEAFGAEVLWDEKSRTAKISYSGKTIEIEIGSYIMKVNGREVSLEVPAEINENRVFVPLRAVAESLNKYVYYKDKFIGITNNGQELSDSGLVLIRQAALRMMN